MKKTVSYDEASANLRKAAELLSKHGLCQYDFVRGGAICLVESIARAIMGRDPDDGSVLLLLGDAVVRILQDRPEITRVLAAAGTPFIDNGVQALCELNNQAGHTTKKLVALLNKAADQPEKKAA